MEETLENLKALCERFPDVQVTRKDSVNAGNCYAGTAEFADAKFPNRESITVKELARYIRVPAVQEVLWYVLRSRSKDMEPR